MSRKKHRRKSKKSTKNMKKRDITRQSLVRDEHTIMPVLRVLLDIHGLNSDLINYIGLYVDEYDGHGHDGSFENDYDQDMNDDVRKYKHLIDKYDEYDEYDEQDADVE